MRPRRFTAIVMQSVFAVLISSVARADNIAVSLTSDHWTVLSYSKIRANEVRFGDREMVIAVQNSAGPVVSKLSEPKTVVGFKIAGSYFGEKSVETTAFDEDSVLRVGLVVVGTKTLSAFKRLFVADWVKKLFALAPEGIGLDRIQFFNLTNRKDLLNRSRVHPNSDLINETISGDVAKPGPFSLEITWPSPLRVAAIWLSVDGDDTQSTFETTVKSLVLKSK